LPGLLVKKEACNSIEDQWFGDRCPSYNVKQL
jgi:hypothetical protein